MASTAKRGKIVYYDDANMRTTIILNNNSIDYIINNFISRVIDDKGTIESIDCLINSMYNDITYEYCAAGDPLNIKWVAERYSVTKPSSAKIQIIIKDETDRYNMLQIVEERFQVSIYKEDDNGDDKLFWRGVTTAPVTNEVYAQFPYVFTLNANDSLKQSESRSFLMIDFPDIYPDSIISVRDFIIKFIDINLYPKESFVLNVVADTFNLSTSDGLNDIFFDPRVLMEEDKDEYLSFKDAIRYILEPLDYKLFQWNGEWWIVGNDVDFIGTGSRNIKHTIVNGEITNIVNVSEEREILNMYQDHTSNPNEPREVEASTYLRYLPAWRSVEIESKFQKNKDALNQFSNRTGNFYYVHNKFDETSVTTLEFEEYNGIGHPSDIRTNTFEDNGVELYSYLENDGYLGINSKSYFIDEYISKIQVLPYFANTPYDILELNVDFYDLSSYLEGEVEHRMFVKIDTSEQIHYLYINDAGDYGWNTAEKVFDHKGNNFHLKIPMLHPMSNAGVASIEVRVYRPKMVTEHIFKRQQYFKNYNISLYPNSLGLSDWKDKVQSIINVGELYTETLEWIFGITSPVIQDNSHLFHFSTPTNSTGSAPIKEYGKMSFDDGLIRKSAVDWKLISLVRDNTKATKVLEGKYRGRDINMLQLIRDFEGNVYKFTSGKFNDKTFTWDIVYTEFKAYIDPSGPLLGSFSALSFDDSFQKTIS